jgi:hypothetical protein
LLTLTHEAGDQIKTMTSSIRKSFDFILANAPQLPKIERWPILVRYIMTKSSQPDQKIPQFSIREPLIWLPVWVKRGI